MTPLLELRGVGVPMASAMLMLVDPRRYGVIETKRSSDVWGNLELDVMSLGADVERRQGVCVVRELKSA